MTRRIILRYCTLLFLLAASALWSCTLQDSGKNISAYRTIKRKLDIRVMGIRRYYMLHIPAGYSPDKKYPLVIVLHGAFSTPVKIEKKSGFSMISDRGKFLVAYPSGAFGIFGFLKHWNAGHCCGKAAKDNIDDVGFLLKVMDDIQTDFAVDKNRIYMAGFSNGGMLTYRFAAEHTERLAAAAVLGGSLGGKASAETPLWKIPRPKSPLPLIVFHARDDLSVPYNGGISPQKGGEREYIPVADSIDFWVKNNNCDTDPLVEELYGNRVTKKEWLDSTHGNDVYLYTIDNWGHRWPGRYYTDKLDKDDPFKGFSAADVIWTFFRSHSAKIQQ
jgi:polyhydroxybutyrate depolymerase